MHTVLISGVSSGIGQAAAEVMLKNNWRVYGSVRKAGDAAALSTAYPSSFHELIFDVTDAASRRQGVQQIESNGHQLQALVNNAGIAVSGPIETMDESRYRQQYEVNVFGLLGLTKDCLPLLHKAREAGISPVRIVNISSVSGILTSPFTSIYSSSKFAVESITDGLRRELLPFGIDVVSVAPGPVKTPIWKKGLGQTEGYTGTRYAYILEKLPAYIANAEAGAIPAEAIGQRIYEVLSKQRVKPFHLLMKKAWLVRLLRYFPKRRMDKFTAKRLSENSRY